MQSDENAPARPAAYSKSESGTEPTETWIEAAGTKVLVRQTGRGRPVLLINGLGSHTATWAPVETHFTGLHLISFDSPGIGRSPYRAPPQSIGGLARLALDILDQLGFDEVDVLGYSMGGTIAQTLAHLAPTRVRKLVLVATGPGWGCVPGQWGSMIHLYNPLRYYSEWYYQKSIGAIAGGRARTDKSFIEKQWRQRFAERPRVVPYYSQIAAVASWSSLRWLHEITAPTLVVVGGDDPLLPAVNSFMLARRIPLSRLEVHPEEGHLLLFDTRSPALHSIHEFLTAPSTDESRTWQRAQEVDRSLEEHMLRNTHAGMFPWGRASAAYRAFSESSPQ